MKFLVTVLIICFPSILYGEVTCHNAQPEELACGPVTVANRIGDILSAPADFPPNVCARLSFIDVRTTGSGQDMGGPFEAKVPNETVWLVWRTPTQVTSNWWCNLTVKVNGRVPIPGRVKAKAEGIIPIEQAAIGTLTGAIGACFRFGWALPVCATLIITNSILIWDHARQQGIVNDPWDDNYNQPFDPVLPSAAELGLDYAQCTEDALNDGCAVVYYANRAIDSGLAIVAWGEAVHVAANRANSCREVNDPCADWQADRARIFLQNMAASEAETSSWLAWVANEYRAVGWEWQPQIIQDAADLLYMSSVQIMEVLQ